MLLIYVLYGYTVIELYMIGYLVFYLFAIINKPVMNIFVYKNFAFACYTRWIMM